MASFDSPGGMEPGLKEKTAKDPIKNESSNGLLNERGAIAMARTNDPDSATAQFFINVKDNPRLDKSGASAGYCVFGKVIEGMDVVDKIVAVETDTQRQHQNVPVKVVTFKPTRTVSKLGSGVCLRLKRDCPLHKGGSPFSTVE